MVLDTMREAVRNLQSWHSLFEALEVSDTLTAADGRSYTLWDVQYLYDQRHRLPNQQRIAIELCLYDNVLERDAARRMGTSDDNPVAVYATVGLTKLIRMAKDGDLPLFRFEMFERSVA